MAMVMARVPAATDLAQVDAVPLQIPERASEPGADKMFAIRPQSVQADGGGRIDLAAPCDDLTQGRAQGFHEGPAWVARPLRQQKVKDMLAVSRPADLGAMQRIHVVKHDHAQPFEVGE